MNRIRTFLQFLFSRRAVLCPCGFAWIILLLLFSSCSRQVPSYELSWKLDLSTGRREQAGPVRPGPVRTNALIRDSETVVFDTEGRVLRRIGRPAGTRAVISARSPFLQAVYRSYGHFIDIIRPDGSKERLRSESYPILSGEGRLMLLVTGEAEGLILRSLEEESESDLFTPGHLITDIAAGPDIFAVGFLNGDLVLMGRDFLRRTNNAVRRVRQEETQVPIVKKLAFSGDGRFLACRHGHHPERISVYDAVSLRPFRHIRTEGAQRTKAVLSFSPRSARLMSETPGGFRLYDRRTGRLLLVHEPPEWRQKRFFSCGWIDEDRMVVALRLEMEAIVQVLNRKGFVLWQKALPEARLRVLESGPEWILLASPERAFLWSASGEGL